jgi:hypothetical protein
MPAYYTYKFGSMGHTLTTATQTEFFEWFHLQPAERRIERPGAVVRYRPSGGKFHDVCFLDLWTAPAGELVRMELCLNRTFIDGPDGLHAQDLVKSFLTSVLPAACRDSLPDFMAEISYPSAVSFRPGRTPGYAVFLGRKTKWKVQTGWSRLRLGNTTISGVPSLTVQVMPNPRAPNARPTGDPQADSRWDYRRLLGAARSLFGRDW